MLPRIISLFFWLCLSSACTELPIPDRTSFPLAAVTEVVPTSTGLVVSGNYQGISAEEIVEAHINWFPAYLSGNLDDPRTLTTAELTDAGEFTANIERDLFTDTRYTLRLRLLLDNGDIIYSSPFFYLNEQTHRHPLVSISKYDSREILLTGLRRSEENEILFAEGRLAVALRPGSEDVSAITLANTSFTTRTFFELFSSPRYWFRRAGKRYFHAINNNVGTLGIFDLATNEFTQVPGVPPFYPNTDPIPVGDSLYYLGNDRNMYAFSLTDPGPANRIGMPPFFTEDFRSLSIVHRQGESFALLTSNASVIDSGPFRSSLWRFSLDRRTWERLTDYPLPEGQLWLAAESDKILIGNRQNSRLHLYLPEEDRWQFAGWLFPGITQGNAQFVNGKHYVVGRKDRDPHVLLYAIDLNSLVDLP